MQWSISVARIVALAYLTIVITLTLMESRLVYPGAYMTAASMDAVTPDPEIVSVEYVSTGEIPQVGRLLQRNGSDDVVLFLHGNGVKAAWMDDWIRRLSNSLDATVLAAEYRGFADDQTPSERGILDDCFAARDLLCERLGKSADEIILYGNSLGGGCAVALAARGGAKCLILERTFDRLVDVAAQQYPLIPVRWLLRNRYDSIAKLTAYNGPLIVVHGNADELIPIEHAERLYASSNSTQKHWIRVEGLNHVDALPQPSLDEIAEKLREFTSEDERRAE